MHLQSKASEFESAVTYRRCSLRYMNMLKDRCKEARLSAGYKTVPPFAHAIGVEPATIYFIEGGRTQALKADTLAAYARVTGKSAEWLRTGRGPSEVGTVVATGKSASAQRATLAAALKLLDFVREVAVDPITDSKYKALYDSVVEKVESIGPDGIMDGTALVDAARQVAASLREMKQQ